VRITQSVISARSPKNEGSREYGRTYQQQRNETVRRSSEAFIPGDITAFEGVGDGIRRQFCGYNDSIMMVKVAFEAGAQGYVHSHPHSQASYVESGEFDVLIDGVEKRLGPGDSFFIEPNLDHGAVCREAGVLLDVFSPVREDFLNEDES
jgi:quercetin dioxygenase-like cupin family protein